MKIETLGIYGFVPAFQAMRLPKGGKPQSTCTLEEAYTPFADSVRHSVQTTQQIALADLQLAERLVRAGDEHAKAIRGIMVYAQIEAPIYWWREMETYRAGRERLSCESTMHIDCKGLTGAELVQAKESMPMGKEQKAVDVYSYQCLRNIYRQRKHHRLPHWQNFCKWVETLPFADKLITCGL